MLSEKNIFLLAPKFFNYENEIIREMENKGARVTFFCERPFTSSFGKILLRLRLGGLVGVNYIIHKYFENIVRECIRHKPDYLVLINPESIPPGVISEIKRHLVDIKLIVYMWDSINNKVGSVDYIPLVDSFFSFDYSDAEDSDKIRFLPLFYIDSYRNISLSDTPNRYSCCFIGTAHSDRYSLTKKIINQKTNTVSFLYLYCPSKILFFMKKIFTSELRGLKYKEISFKPLEKVDLYSAISGSDIIIDISHPEQTGLTMRTIEMIGANKKLITTNHNVQFYDFYNQNNICIVDKTDPIVPSCFFVSQYENLSVDIYNKYSISSWVDNLFDI